jgi:hypothetical protein
VVGAALVVVLLVGVGVFLSRGEPLTLGGRYVTGADGVLADADDVLAGYVTDRQGVAADAARCWFELSEAAGHEVRDALLCGPVLFVDGDVDRAWLRFPVIATADGGDVRLDVAALPVDPVPDRLADPALLYRPDGGEPPAGTGRLQPPPPPRAEAGWSATGPFPDVAWSPPAGPSRLSGPAAAVTVTGLAQPTRVRAGDDARRPADGEHLLAVRYVIAAGEGTSTAAPRLSYQVGGRDPVPVAPALVAVGTTVEAVVSVPEDADAADLVVEDAGVEQRLSLVTGAPGSENLQVLARVNRTADVDRSRVLEGTLSAPGRVSASFPFTVTVDGASLRWSTGGTSAAGPDRGLLLVDVAMALPDQSPGAVPVGLLSLRLPDGTVVRATDLAGDPSLVLPGFDVPADLTSAVLRFGGTATFRDGAAADFGTGRLDFPIAITAG